MSIFISKKKIDLNGKYPKELHQQYLKTGPLKTVRQQTAPVAEDLADAPAAEVVETVIRRAALREASDIHIEPGESFLRIRLRQDGVLQTAFTLPKDKTAAVISRIKVMADLDIAEKRRPQDGRIRFSPQRHEGTKVIEDASTRSMHSKNDNKTIDIRVSTLSTDFGEKVVMRLLDKGSFDLSLENLGFNTLELSKFRNAVKLPHGMILVTGPTGSGKTTTLYSALNFINNPGQNIITVEDPIEYNLEGINQSHVKSDIGYTFASALRSFLRQDPDVIMVGEIRDAETAEIAVRAA